MLMGLAVFLFCWYLIEVFELLRGSWDHRLSAGLRILLLSATLFFLTHPVLQTTSTLKRSPEFLVLEDDTYSVRQHRGLELQKQARLLTKGLSEYGTVHSMRSLELKTSLQDRAENSRAVFLLTDGQSYSFSEPVEETPLFVSPTKPGPKATTALRLADFPARIYANQEFTLPIEALNFPVSENQTDLQLQCADRKATAALELVQGQGRGQISLKAPGTGFHACELRALRADQTLQFGIEVAAQPRQISLVTPSPSSKSGVLLRQLSREASVRVTAVYTRIESRQPESDLWILMHMDVHKARSWLIKTQGPVLLVSDSPALLSSLFSTLRIVASPSEWQGAWNWQGPSLPDFRRFLFGSTDSATDILSTLPDFQPPFQIQPVETMTPLLSIRKGSQSYPLALLGELQSRSMGFLFSSLPKGLQWGPDVSEGARTVSRRLSVGMVLELLKSSDQTIDEIRGPSYGIEGDTLRFSLPYQSQTLSIRNLQTGVEQVREGSQVVELNLPAGAYQLGSGDHTSFALTIAPPRSEYRYSESAREGFSDFLQRCGAIRLSKGAGNDAWMQQVPADVLAHEYEVVESSFSLQASTIALILLLVLVAGEWILRFYRRMV